MNLIKPQVCHSKCSPGACGSISVRAPLEHRHVWARAHLTLDSFYTGELNQWWLINLLYSSATTAVNLSEVLTAYKVISWLLAQKKLALKQEMGWMLPSQTGSGMGCGILNHPEGSAPHSWARLYHVTTSSAKICSLVACKESSGVGCCLLA